MIESPSVYNLPHPEWRTHQLETVKWVTAHPYEIMLCEQPTGSGKSAVAAAQSVNKRTVILVHTKNLQLAYGEIYDAHIIMGKSNYPCGHMDAQPGATANECIYADSSTSMKRCQHYGKEKCPYSVAKLKALVAPLVVANYAYWLVSRQFRNSDIELLVLDECHLLPKVITEWAGATINKYERIGWDLDGFPRISSANNFGMTSAKKWMRQSEARMRETHKDLKMAVEDGQKESKELRACERLWYKIAATNQALDHCPEGWYLKSGPGKCFYRGRPVPGIVVKPLTSRYNFHRLFGGDYGILLMSATIGDFDSFAKELGIGLYEGRKVPNRYPPEARPVYVLKVPKLMYQSPVSTYQVQADRIAQAIGACPDTWSGLIHVTRKTAAPELKQKLIAKGIPEGRLWIPPTKNTRGKNFGTQEQADMWDLYRDANPGAIAIVWQFHQGYDGTEEKINILAKVPYASLADEFEKAKLRYNHRLYALEAAWGFMQILGRTRRGRPEDYDLNGEKRGLVAVADGAWKKIKSYLSDDIKESLVVV